MEMKRAGMTTTDRFRWAVSHHQILGHLAFGRSRRNIAAKLRSGGDETSSPTTGRTGTA